MGLQAGNFYHVKWRGFGPEYNSWVHENDFDDKEFLRKFEEEQKALPRQRTGRAMKKQKTTAGSKEQTENGAIDSGKEYEFDAILADRTNPDVSV